VIVTDSLKGMIPHSAFDAATFVRGNVLDRSKLAQFSSEVPVTKCRILSHWYKILQSHCGGVVKDIYEILLQESYRYSNNTFTPRPKADRITEAMHR
jgi:hypothetical protein